MASGARREDEATDGEPHKAESSALCSQTCHSPTFPGLNRSPTFCLTRCRFFAIIRRYTPDVEEYSIDECAAVFRRHDGYRLRFGLRWPEYLCVRTIPCRT